MRVVVITLRTLVGRFGICTIYGHICHALRMRTVKAIGHQVNDRAQASKLRPTHFRSKWL
jgi:hypothetical protein